MHSLRRSKKLKILTSLHAQIFLGTYPFFSLLLFQHASCTSTRTHTHTHCFGPPNVFVVTTHVTYNSFLMHCVAFQFHHRCFATPNPTIPVQEQEQQHQQALANTISICMSCGTSRQILGVSAYIKAHAHIYTYVL